ncbi:MAG: hypothetical protein GY953_50265, partial [bacterium]|nr:hypothetical protein [bacterium]
NYTNARNYTLFQMDGNHFYRKQVSKGKSTQLAKVKHGIGKQPYFTLMVDVSSSAIVHKVLKDGAWADLDNWQETSADFSVGKFGFLVPKGDRIGLSDFSFTPQS